MSQDVCGELTGTGRPRRGQQGRIIRGNPLTGSGREMRWRAPGRPSGCPSTSPPAQRALAIGRLSQAHCLPLVIEDGLLLCYLDILIPMQLTARGGDVVEPGTDDAL